MAADWRRAAISELAQQRREKVRPQRDDETPYVALEHIPNGGGRLVGASVAGTATSHKTRFRAGDTLFGKLRPNLRKVVRADFEGVCSTDIIAVGPTDWSDPGFLYQLLASNVVYRHVMGDITGTKMPRTSWKHLSTLAVRVPPLPEQRAIAAVLAAVDEAIARTEVVIAATEGLRRALLHELLTRGVPGRHTEWKQVPGLGTVPSCWEVVRLGEVFEILDSRRVPLNAGERAGMAGSYPYYGANGVVDHIDRWIFDDDLVLLAEDGGNFDDFAKRPVAYRVRGKCWVNNHAHVLKARSEHLRSFAFHSLVHKDIRGFIKGSTRSKLTQGGMRRIVMAVPRELREAEQIGNAVDAAEHSLFELRATVDDLRRVKAALSDSLLTGHVRVSSTLGEAQAKLGYIR